MCSERSWGSAERCWLCFLARNAKDSGGVTVTLKGMPFKWESLMIHLKSVNLVRASSGGGVSLFPNELLASLPLLQEFWS